MQAVRLFAREITSSVRCYLLTVGIVAVAFKLHLDLAEVYSRETCDGILHRSWYAVQPAVLRAMWYWPW